MKFTLLAVAALAVAGMTSAAEVHPSEYCEEYHIATAGESCQTLAQKYSVSPRVFEVYNHGLTTDLCASLNEGQVYCVKAPKTKAKRCLKGKKTTTTTTTTPAPTPKEPEPKKTEPKKTPAGGIPASQAKGLNIAHKTVTYCKLYYVVTDNDACEDVAARFGITQNQLFSYNKGLHSVGVHQCDNLDTGKAYCVGI